MRPSFREWYSQRYDKYRTTNINTDPAAYVQSAMNDLLWAFSDYADEVVADAIKRIEEKSSPDV